MKKIFYIIAVVAVFTLSYFYYESYLFKKYVENQNQKKEMNIPINESAPVKSKSQIEIAAPVETVWATITKIDNWPGWQKDVTKAVVHGEIKEGTNFDWKAGGLSFRSTIHTSKPMTDFGWTGTTPGASAIHNWFFESRGNTTIVKVEESLQGVFPRLFKPYFQKNLDAGVLKNLQELKSAAEKK